MPDQTTQNNIPPKPWYLTHKFLSSVLAILVLIVVGGIIYYAKIEKQTQRDLSSVATPQTPSEGADWKNYKNELCGFEMTLTDAWKNYQVEADPKDSCVLTFYVPDKFSYQSDGYSEIMIIGRESSQDYQSEVDAQGSEGEHPFLLGSNDQYGYVNNWSQDLPSDYTRLEIDKVTSTFKIIDSTSADTSTWKTYTNSQYGFEFKYPSDWKQVEYQIQDAVEVAPAEGMGHNIYFYAALAFRDFADGRQFDQASYTKTPIVVNNIEAEEYIPKDGTSPSTILISHNEELYKIIIWRKIEQTPQILSTFQFTK